LVVLRCDLDEVLVLLSHGGCCVIVDKVALIARLNPTATSTSIDLVHHRIPTEQLGWKASCIGRVAPRSNWVHRLDNLDLFFVRTTRGANLHQWSDTIFIICLLRCISCT